MTKYRVVYNGLNYRVQWLGKTWFLRRLKWYWLREYTWVGDYIVEFSSESEARAAIQASTKQNKAKKQGYVPI